MNEAEIKDHVAARLKSRYGFHIKTKNLWERIRDGRAKQCTPRLGDRVLWEIPYRTPGSQVDDIVVEVVTDKALTMMFTALPSYKNTMRAAKQRRKEFFKGGFEDDDEDVTVFSR